jgi:AGZA family xanthine/uracil permease-like MFS transporter
LLGAGLTLFGVMHSVQLSGGVYLPWLLDAAACSVVGQFAGAYAVLAVVLALLSIGGTRRLQAERTGH